MRKCKHFSSTDSTQLRIINQFLLSVSPSNIFVDEKINVLMAMEIFFVYIQKKFMINWKNSKISCLFGALIFDIFNIFNVVRWKWYFGILDNIYSIRLHVIHLDHFSSKKKKGLSNKFSDVKALVMLWVMASIGDFLYDHRVL